MTFVPAVNTYAQNLQIIASCVIPIIAIIGALVANRAIQSQREINARRIYFDYLALAFQNPKFAYPPNSSETFDHKNQTIDGSRKEYEKYEWFLSMLMASIEGIIEIASRKSVWQKTALLQLDYHLAYLSQHNNNPWISTLSRTYSILQKKLKVPVNA